MIYNRYTQQYQTHMNGQSSGSDLQAQHRAGRCFPGAHPAVHGDAAVLAQVSHCILTALYESTGR